MPVPNVAPAGYPYGPQVTFKTQDVLPPSAVYVSAQDAIELQARVPSVAVNIDLTLRLLTPQGEVKTELYTFPVSTMGAGVFTATVPPSEGFLISAHIEADNVSRGQCFVKLHLRPSLGPQESALGALLIQGYVSGDDHLSYPQSPTESSLNGRGWLHVVTIPNPAPGNDWVATVPAGVRWNLKNAFAILTADATAGNRSVFLQMDDASFHGHISMPSNGVQPPSSTRGYNFLQGGAFSAYGSQITAPLVSDCLLGPGWTIRTVSVGLGAADQYSAIALDVEEYIAL